MTAKYYSQLTAAGLAELTAAQIAGEAVEFTHIAVGDGGGAFVAPDDHTVGLVRQVALAEITSIRADPNHPTWFIAEAVIPEDVGGWTARELALIGGRAQDLVMAVSNYPEVEKISIGNGSARAMLIRMYFAYANAATISLYVSPQAYATGQTVADAIAAHKAEADPHPQYLTKTEADAFYDRIGLAADAIDQDAARLSAHVAAADPHPQYINAARAASAAAANWAEQFFYAAGM